MKILIVDDEQYICDSIARNLRRIGFSVVIELEGEKVLEVIGKEKPDIVLLDLILGPVNGIDILKEIKEKHKNIIVIVITADEEKETERAALKEGADDFLRKPFKTDSLRKAIREKVETILLKKDQMGKPSVLLADDSDDYRQQIVNFMSKNYQVNLSEAKDGMAAVNAVKAGKFDLVILDIKMPGQDGIKVLNEIKDALPLANVIVLSGWDDKGVVLKAMNMGVFAYLLKSDPDIFDVLRDKVESLLISQGKLMKTAS